MKKILMVCLGNICRSPLAEGILQHKINQQNILAKVDSAGTANYHVGQKPDYRSIDIAKKYGIDISHLRGRQFTPSDFDNFDYIYVMDKNNYADVLCLADNTEHKNKVELILNLIYPGQNRAVPDPYYGGIQEFEDVYKILDVSTDKIIELLKQSTI